MVQFFVQRQIHHSGWLRMLRFSHPAGVLALRIEAPKPLWVAYPNCSIVFIANFPQPPSLHYLTRINLFAIFIFSHSSHSSQLRRICLCHPHPSLQVIKTALRSPASAFSRIDKPSRLNPFACHGCQLLNPHGNLHYKPILPILYQKAQNKTQYARFGLKFYTELAATHSLI